MLKKMANKKTVVIAGCGALGSHLVQFIRNEEIKIKIIDYQEVERKNILSQFHSSKFVGKSKIQSLQQTMHFLFGIKLDGVPHKISDNNIEILLKDSDLVIDCLDNGAARKLIQNFVRRNKIECLHGALSANGDFGQVIWDENFIIDVESSVGGATCENGEHLAFIAIVSAFLAKAIHQFLYDGKKIGFQVNPSGSFKT